MQTGCKNACVSSWLRVPQLHAAAGRLSPGALALWSEPVQNGLSRACLGAAPPLPRPGGGCRTAYRIAKLSEDGPRFQPKLLRTGRYMPRLFIWKTQRLRSTATDGKIYAWTLDLEDTTTSFKVRTIFPKYRGYFDRVALQIIVPKYSGYFDDGISRNIPMVL